jgi:hypothetical protein
MRGPTSRTSPHWLSPKVRVTAPPSGQPSRRWWRPRPRRRPATPFWPKPDAMLAGEQSGDPPEGELDTDDLEGSMSLAAIEAEFKPKVLETLRGSL